MAINRIKIDEYDLNLNRFSTEETLDNLINKLNSNFDEIIAHGGVALEMWL